MQKRESAEVQTLVHSLHFGLFVFLTSAKLLNVSQHVCKGGFGFYQPITQAFSFVLLCAQSLI